MSSTATDSPRRFTVLTLVLYWSCTLSGLAIPWIATVAVDMAKHDQSLAGAVGQLRLHLFAPGYNLFVIALINAMPFMIFAVFLLFHLGRAPMDDRTLRGRRSAGVLMTVIGLVAFSLWTHLTTLWQADAQAALAYLFLPFLLLLLIPICYAFGRALSTLVFR
jgi:hypothetical protein